MTMADDTENWNVDIKITLTDNIKCPGLYGQYPNQLLHVSPISIGGNELENTFGLIWRIILAWMLYISCRKYKDYVYRKMLVQEYLKKIKNI